MTHTFDDDILRTCASLRDEGLGPRDIDRLLARGELTRVRRSIYAEPAELDDRDAHARLVRATMPLTHPETVASHMSAAVLHGLPVQFEDLTHVHATREGPGHGRKGSVLWLRNARLPEAERTSVGDVAVTTLERTAFDLARNLSFEWGVIVMDAALRAGADRALLTEMLDQRRRWRGSVMARRVLAFADAKAESPTESLSRVQMMRLGIPRPTLQYQVVLDGQVVARTDFGWPDLRTVGEADGREKYGRLLRPDQEPADAVMAEKRREERIRQAGYWVTRWGWQEACNRAVLGSQLRRAFAHAPAA